MAPRDKDKHNDCDNFDFWNQDRCVTNSEDLWCFQVMIDSWFIMIPYDGIWLYDSIWFHNEIPWDSYVCWRFSQQQSHVQPTQRNRPFNSRSCRHPQERHSNNPKSSVKQQPKTHASAILVEFFFWGGILSLCYGGPKKNIGRKKRIYSDWCFFKVATEFLSATESC